MAVYTVPMGMGLSRMLPSNLLSMASAANDASKLATVVELPLPEILAIFLARQTGLLGIRSPFGADACTAKSKFNIMHARPCAAMWTPHNAIHTQTTNTQTLHIQ